MSAVSDNYLHRTIAGKRVGSAGELDSRTASCDWLHDQQVGPLGQGPIDTAAGLAGGDDNLCVDLPDGSQGSSFAPSAAMVALHSLIGRVAPWNVPVVVIAESETQHRSIARQLHAVSGKKPASFVTLRAGQLAPQELAELVGSELRRGEPGTLFLQDLADLGQASCNALQSAVRRSTSGVTRGVNGSGHVRIVTGCRALPGRRIPGPDLPAVLARSLDVVRLYVPPLCARPSDIIPIVDGVARLIGESITTFDDAVLRCFESYAWPGDIDELTRTVARLVVCRSSERVTVADLVEFAPELVASAGSAVPEWSSEVRRSKSLASALPDVQAIADLVLSDGLSQLDGLHDAVFRALRFIGENSALDISAKTLASESLVSPSHLAHLFKRQLGFTSRQLLHQVRVERAKRMLLADRSRRITDIALDVGFRDLSHFLKTFRRIVGSSPGEFRQLAGDDDSPKCEPACAVSEGRVD